MIVISATDFKARCLELLDRAREGETIHVTKRGKVVAQVGPPVEEQREHAKFGFAKGQLQILGDIISPLDDVEWEALK